MSAPDFDATPGRAQPGFAQPGSPGIPSPGPAAAPVFGYARAGTGLMPRLTATAAAALSTCSQPGLAQPGLAGPGVPVIAASPGSGTAVSFGSVRAGSWP